MILPTCLVNKGPRWWTVTKILKCFKHCLKKIGFGLAKKILCSKVNSNKKIYQRLQVKLHIKSNSTKNNKTLKTMSKMRIKNFHSRFKSMK